MTIIRLVFTTLGNVLTGLWKNLSPFCLTVTSGFGTWHLTQAYFYSRYDTVPLGDNSELIFYLSIGLPIFLMIGAMLFFTEEEARKRGKQSSNQ
jgi:hypothetical protein